MAQTFSKTQIDKLGERLKLDHHSDDDLQMLAEYRNSFAGVFQAVSETIQEKITNGLSGRMKTNASIIAKLRRERIRLTQMQDVVGCRLIVRGISEQEVVTQSLTSIFESFSIVDRREKPSYGYRAIHLIVKLQEKPVEVQVRTSLQQLWAELSERFFDVEPDIKYGGGDDIHKTILATISRNVKEIEMQEAVIEQLKMNSGLSEDQDLKMVVSRLDALIASQKTKLTEALQEAIGVSFRSE